MRMLPALLSSLALATGGARGTDPSFESYWRDGQAELDGYRLRVARYSQDRAGEAVLIYVTEPFSESQRVKFDHPERDPADTVEAFTLNLRRLAHQDLDWTQAVIARAAAPTVVRDDSGSRPITRTGSCAGNSRRISRRS